MLKTDWRVSSVAAQMLRSGGNAGLRPAAKQLWASFISITPSPARGDGGDALRTVRHVTVLGLAAWLR